MKQGRIIGIILSVINVILVVTCVVFYMKADRTAPEFEVRAADIVYREGVDNAELLEGITAYDNVDGEVTDRIVIEKMIENRENGSLVVFYAVSDKAGNVAKFSKAFQAAFDTDSKAEEENTDEMAMRLKEAGIEAELENGAGTWKADNMEALTPSPSPVSETESAGTPEAEPTNTPQPEAEPTNTPAKEQQEEAQKEEESQPSQGSGNTGNAESSGAPVLALKVSEVKTAVGSAPAWVDVIGTLKDDKDNYETLFHNLSVSKYDKNKAGTYHVTVFTEDSDGNKSQEIPLTIVVK